MAILKGKNPLFSGQTYGGTSGDLYMARVTTALPVIILSTFWRDFLPAIINSYPPRFPEENGMHTYRFQNSSKMRLKNQVFGVQ
jgi:hypothetical protein